jgi:hypothetical protein
MNDDEARAPRTAWALGVGFFLLYLACGITFYLQAPRVLRHIDQLFDADIPSRVIDLTHAQGEHERTQLHPLFVLLLNPLGYSLREVLRLTNVSGAGAGSLAAVILCAAAGGTTAGVFFSMLRRLGLGTSAAFGWTLVLGLSASQLLFASLPESFAFSALSLVVLFACGARPQTPRGLLAAGVASFGMVVTNIVAVALIRLRWLDRRRPWTALRTVAIHVAVVVAITGALSLVQLYLYPGAATFLHVQPIGNTDRSSFVPPAGAAEAEERAQELGATLILFNVAAPRLVVTETGTPRTVVEFAEPGVGALRGGAGGLQAILWAAILIVSAVGGVRSRLDREPLAIALVLWIAFNAALHTIFGTSLFLYSCQWTFAVVALTAWGFDRVPVPARVKLGTLAMVVAAQAANNALFILELLRIYARK